MNRYDQIAKALFQAVRPGESLYAILDGARVPELFTRLCVADIEYDSLYRGRSEEALWRIAPYLLRCERNSVFFRLMIEQGWGESWGIYLTSASDLEALLRHFQQFLLVKTDDGTELYFRFYDPRVLQFFLPTCTLEEAIQFFGPATCYLMETEQPGALLEFTLSQLKAERESLC